MTIDEAIKAGKLTWCGPLSGCDVCGGDFGKVMYDASLGYGKSWGNICNGCFILEGCSLGVGRGQKYELAADGKWYQTAGGEGTGG